MTRHGGIPLNIFFIEIDKIFIRLGLAEVYRKMPGKILILNRLHVKSSRIRTCGAVA
jgi:hypothetical protein